MTPPTPPNRLSSYIARGSPMVLDGALATYLETLGADISGALWSASIILDQPSLIKQTHLDYYRAGANVAITASYQASIPGLVKHLQLNEQEAKNVVRKSVELAREARAQYMAETSAEVGNKLFIAGSVGPYGAFLADGSEYRGDYSIPKEEMKDFHRGRIQALVEAGVDILACETIPSKDEAIALIDLLATEFPSTEAWFAFTLRDSERISDGTSLTEMAALFDNVQQVVALGFNCVPDDLSVAALQTLKPLVKRGTLVVYPNSGEQWNAQAREWEGKRTQGSSLDKKTREWREAGAGLVGGCCRTTPEDIRVMKKALE
ncbi:homocysteine S-methyltransferase [Pyrenophora seminiperda CCB06]|uniref:Homocysteine S-methyltransferase n=1 Tax=Pyrenophora seminiperda CCB06 TaxID=1302712 RepID=A0A3M7M7Y0_9PLEO|nr:homocysteine S-methyltransferase [Pyrenophora seminiperda CCB06]